MKTSLNRHHVLEGTALYLSKTFPQIAAENLGYRSQPPFSSKNLREVSLSSSLIYTVEKFKKHFPFPNDWKLISETILNGIKEKAFLDLLSHFYDSVR